MSAGSPVTAIIITYAPERDVLGACIDTLAVQDPAPRIIIADNLAPTDPRHDVALSFGSPDVEVVPLSGNHGFGGAINRIIPNE